MDTATVIDRLTGASEADLPDLLREHAPVLLSSNGALLRPLLHRFGPLDGDGEPWVQLVVAFARHDADYADTRAVALTRGALARFRRAGDRRGEGFALCTLGNQAVSRGRLVEAARYWTAGCDLLGPDSAASAQALANTSLAAYAEGDLRRALAVAELGLAVSLQAGLQRAAGAANVYIAGCCLWTGDLARAEAALAGAERCFAEIADPAERYEWPVAIALDGVLAALRGEDASAERRFGEALQAAEVVDADWIRAVVRVLRAEHTAPWAAHRSIADARLARELLQPTGEEWWAEVARLASGVALGSCGNVAAAAHVLGEALDDGRLIPLEHARCRLLLGEAQLRLGRVDRAVPALGEALRVLERSGARFWAARACAGLARAETSSSVRHWRRAQRLAGRDTAFDRLLRGPTTFRIELLGRPRVLVAGDEVAFPTRQARLLVLALAGAGQRGVAAEVLHSWLWPDVDRALGSRRLKTAMWQARRSLGAVAGRLQRRGATVTLDLAAGECDLAEAVATARSLLTRPAPSRRAVADAALRLSSPVLGGEEYADWVVDLQRRVDALRFELEQVGGSGGGGR